MQYKTLLIWFTFYVFNCLVLVVSAFSFGSSGKNNVGSRDIVKRGGVTDDEPYKHKQRDDSYEHEYEHDQDYEHKYSNHGDDYDDCRSIISKGSVSIIVDSKTYRIPCKTGAVDINNICSDACEGGNIASKTATLVFGTGTYAITSAVACGSNINVIPIQSICAQAISCCDVQCSPNQKCINGICTCCDKNTCGIDCTACPTGQHCTLTQGGTIFQCACDNTPNSCGVQDSCSPCPIPKNGQATCVSGMCDITCNSGYTSCNGTCVDEQTDISNCGSCGNVCSVPTNAHATCMSGACGISCNKGYTSCNGTCVNEQTDISNCGSCGNVCSVPTDGQATCASGACGISCNKGHTSCNGTCVNEQTDISNCGSCGNVCPAPTNAHATCSSGTCSISCNTGYTSCNGTCVDEQTDISNCGSCENVCSIPTDGQATCTSGTCSISCNTGYTSCNGTCVDEQTDISNCGSCGNVCSNPTDGQATCTSGTCGISCNTGYTSCNGTCVDEQTDISNCGSCGNVCPAAPTNAHATCVSGTCGILCNTGYTNCSNTCVNEQTDNANCGSCGNQCNTYQHCESGACVCNDPGNSPCIQKTINFDDLTVNRQVPNCYQSFNWNNDFFVNDDVNPYTQSLPFDVINFFADGADLTRSKPFSIISVYVASPPFGSVTTFKAFLNGQQVGSAITAPPGAVFAFTPDFQNIDRLNVVPTGQYFGLDDLVVCA